MRLRYVGCVILFVVVLGLGVVLAGGLIYSMNIFYLPDRPPEPLGTAVDGWRAQRKMLEIVLRERNVSSRTQPLVFTEKQLNAFLSRHLEESRGIPFSNLRVKLIPGGLSLQGQTRLRSLARAVPFNYIVGYLPASEMDRPVWVVMQARVRLESGRFGKRQEYLRIEPTMFRIGAHVMSARVLSWIVGRELFRWAVPNVIQSVEVEEGRVVVTTRPR